MEVWHLFIGVGAILIPAVLATMARDRALMTMIGQNQNDTKSAIEAATAPIHERINRVRDEYVREDHLNSHLDRIDKRFDNLSDEMRRHSDKVDKGFGEMRRLLQGRTSADGESP